MSIRLSQVVGQLGRADPGLGPSHLRFAFLYCPEDTGLDDTSEANIILNVDRDSKLAIAKLRTL